MKRKSLLRANVFFVCGLAIVGAAHAQERTAVPPTPSAAPSSSGDTKPKGGFPNTTFGGALDVDFAERWLPLKGANLDLKTKAEQDAAVKEVLMIQRILSQRYAEGASSAKFTNDIVEKSLGDFYTQQRNKSAEQVGQLAAEATLRLDALQTMQNRRIIEQSDALLKQNEEMIALLKTIAAKK